MFKEMWGGLNFKPSMIKECCENESYKHKVKIVGFSLLMAAVGTTYQTYFNDLVYRSGIYQQRALAGLEAFTNYRDGDDPETLWNAKNDLDVLNAKDFKELKYLQTWAGSGAWNRNSVWTLSNSRDLETSA